MNKLILRFATGRDANKEYSFEASASLDISIGRDPTCRIVVHELEDAVSRRHALIQPAVSGNADNWIVVDNGSANGLFVNEKEVLQRHPIQDEDVIRFGRSGPTLQVVFEPKPLKATRLVNAAPDIKITRLETPVRAAAPSQMSEESVALITASLAQVSKPAGIGKDTLERRIEEVSQKVEQKSNKKLISIGAVALGLFIALGGFNYYRSQQQSKEIAEVQGTAIAAASKPSAFDSGLATKIRAEWGNSTVLIEGRWQIVDAISGMPVYHQFHRMSSGETYPAYRKLEDGTVRPVITFDAKRGMAVFGGTHTGSGFVVSSDGFIMTNRHVAEAWTAPFAFRFPGILVDAKGGALDTILELPSEQNGWSPMKDRYFLEDKPQSATSVPSRRFEGRNLSLEVIFPNSSIRVPARNGSSSNRHDVALIKIDSAQALSPVPLNYEAHNTLQPGNKVVQLGYPGLSSVAYLATRNQDGTNTGFTRSAVQDVSVNEGIVSKMVPRVANTSVDAFVVTQLGDYIEMNINHSGPGNSGGPIFDSQGKTVALFTADLSNRGTSGSIALGVPIAYGLELLDPTRKVIK